MIEFRIDKKPTQKNVSGWVKQAWYNVGLATLKGTWRRIGYKQGNQEDESTGITLEA